MTMKLLPIADLGAKDIPRQANSIKFGIILPGITSTHGSKLRVHIIHELDQHIFDIKPMIFDMVYSYDNAYPEYPDFWKCTVTIDGTTPDSFGQKAPKNSHWGDSSCDNQTYIYWYSLEHNDLNGRNDIEIDPVIGKKILNWINDPFAREAGKGKMSAFTLGYKQYKWSGNESVWKTPYIKDLVVYEMMISEFAGSIDEAIKKLSYIKDLGFNAIEVMPVSNVVEDITWGYMPIGHFAIEERYGSRSDFQKFVDEAHKVSLAVILDVVYNN